MKPTPDNKNNIDIAKLRKADLVSCHCREDGNTYCLQGTTLAKAVILASTEAREAGVDFIAPEAVMVEVEVATFADMDRLWLELRCQKEGAPMSDAELALEHIRRRQQDCERGITWNTSDTTLEEMK